MKILHVIAGLEVGGAEVLLRRLCPMFAGKGCDNHVVCLGQTGSIATILQQEGTDVDCLGLDPGRISFGAWLRLRKIIKKHKPDIVQGWMYHGALAAKSAGFLRTHPKIILAVHYTPVNITRERLSTKLSIRLLSFLSTQFDAICYVSTASARVHEELGYSCGRIKVIPNGFDLEDFKPDLLARQSVRSELGIQEDDFVIGQIARWHPMKAHEDFLNAAAIFLEKKPNAVFVLVGNGIDFDNKELVDCAKALGIMKNLRLCGCRDDVNRINSALDIATSSSAYGEAFPLVLGEAMACGVPCVATDVGDAKTIIGETGCIVPPKNPIALSQAWEKMARLVPKKRRELGERARERIKQQYSLMACVDAYVALYQEVVGE